MCLRCKARPDYGTNLNLNRKVLDSIKWRSTSALVLAVAVGCGLGPGRLFFHVGADGDPRKDAHPLQDHPAVFRREGRHGALEGVFDLLLCGSISSVQFSWSFSFPIVAAASVGAAHENRLS